MREPEVLGLHFTTHWESLQRRTFYAIVMTGTKEFLMMGRLVDKFIAAASVQGRHEKAREPNRTTAPTLAVPGGLGPATRA